MNIRKLTLFFMWCSIMNAALLLLTIALCLLMPDLVYTTQSALFSIPRESIELVIYSFLAMYKVLFLVFNLVPYLALVILEKRITA